MISCLEPCLPYQDGTRSAADDSTTSVLTEKFAAGGGGSAATNKMNVALEETPSDEEQLDKVAAEVAAAGMSEVLNDEEDNGSATMQKADKTSVNKDAGGGLDGVGAWFTSNLNNVFGGGVIPAAPEAPDSEARGDNVSPEASGAATAGQQREGVTDDDNDLVSSYPSAVGENACFVLGMTVDSALKSLGVVSKTTEQQEEEGASASKDEEKTSNSKKNDDEQKEIIQDDPAVVTQAETVYSIKTEAKTVATKDTTHSAAPTIAEEGDEDENEEDEEQRDQLEELGVPVRGIKTMYSTLSRATVSKVFPHSSADDSKSDIEGDSHYENDANDEKKPELATTEEEPEIRTKVKMLPMKPKENNKKALSKKSIVPSGHSLSLRSGSLRRGRSVERSRSHSSKTTSGTSGILRRCGKSKKKRGQQQQQQQLYDLDEMESAATKSVSFDLDQDDTAAASTSKSFEEATMATEGTTTGDKSKMSAISPTTVVAATAAVAVTGMSKSNATANATPTKKQTAAANKKSGNKLSMNLSTFRRSRSNNKQEETPQPPPVSPELVQMTADLVSSPDIVVFAKQETDDEVKTNKNGTESEENNEEPSSSSVNKSEQNTTDANNNSKKQHAFDYFQVVIAEIKTDTMVRLLSNPTQDHTFKDLRAEIEDECVEDLPFSKFKFLVEAKGMAVTSKQEKKWKVRDYDLTNQGDGSYKFPYRVYIKEAKK